MKSYKTKIREKLLSIKDLSTVGIANLVGNSISAVFWLVLASLMDAEQYGEINYFIAIASVASAISFLGAGNALMVFSAKENRITHIDCYNNCKYYFIIDGFCIIF